MNAIHPTPQGGRPLTPEDDVILPFAVDDLDVRGRVAHMGSVLDTILTQHDYPEPVSRLLGEAVVLTGLLATALKLDGRFILQMQGDGPVSLVVVDFRSPNGVRGYARFDPDAFAGRGDGAGERGVADLVGRGHMALTVDPGATMRRYQGIVPLDGRSLEEIAQAYFAQSEQIPTFIRLAVAETLERQPGEAPRKRWRGGGISVQFLPERTERIVRRDISPGDAPEGTEPRDERPDDDAWVEARMRTETVEDHELIDPDVTPARLLVRLFNQRDVRVFDAIPLEQKCHCSRERIHGILGQFPAEERASMVEDGEIVVTCEFCNRVYRFDPDEV